MPLVKCGLCGKEHYVRPGRIAAGRGKFCSRECASKARRNEANEAVCEWCGISFRKKGRPQKYCSRSCAATAAHTSNRQKAFRHTMRSSVQTAESPYSLCEDPWASGAIPPDRYGRDLYRMPDTGLGF